MLGTLKMGTQQILMRFSSIASMSSRVVSKKAQLAVHDGVLLPTVMYGTERWVWQKQHTSGVNAVEMRALRSLIGIKLSDRVRKEVIIEE
jgi:hypothetical protein